LNINSIIIKLIRKKNDNSVIFEKKEIKNNEILNLNMIKGNKNMKKMLQIKFGCSNEYSCPFDLEDMGDIDLKIEIDENMKHIIEEKNEEIDKEIKKLKLLEKKKKKEEQQKEQSKKEEIAKNIEQEKDKEEEENLINNDDEEEELIPNKDKTKEEKEKEAKKDDNKDKDKELTPDEDRQKRLEEKNKLLEKYKLRPRKYIIFKQNLKDYLLVHIAKSTKNGQINVVLFPPEYPQYIISNESKYRLSFKQKKDDFKKEIFYLEKNESIPYVWGDTLKMEKLLIVFMDKNEAELNLNDVRIITKDFKLKNNNKFTFYFQTLIENNKTRKLVIKNESIKNKNRGYFLEVMKGQKKISKYEIYCNY